MDLGLDVVWCIEGVFVCVWSGYGCGCVGALEWVIVTGNGECWTDLSRKNWDKIWLLEIERKYLVSAVWRA